MSGSSPGQEAARRAQQQQAANGRARTHQLHHAMRLPPARSGSRRDAIRERGIRGLTADVEALALPDVSDYSYEERVEFLDADHHASAEVAFNEVQTASAALEEAIRNHGEGSTEVAEAKLALNDSLEQFELHSAVMFNDFKIQESKAEHQIQVSENEIHKLKQEKGIGRNPFMWTMRAIANKATGLSGAINKTIDAERELLEGKKGKLEEIRAQREAAEKLYAQAVELIQEGNFSEAQTEFEKASSEMANTSTYVTKDDPVVAQYMSSLTDVREDFADVVVSATKLEGRVRLVRNTAIIVGGGLAAAAAIAAVGAAAVAAAAAGSAWFGGGALGAAGIIGIKALVGIGAAFGFGTIVGGGTSLLENSIHAQVTETKTNAEAWKDFVTQARSDIKEATISGVATVFSMGLVGTVVARYYTGTRALLTPTLNMGVGETATFLKQSATIGMWNGWGYGFADSVTRGVVGKFEKVERQDENGNPIMVQADNRGAGEILFRAATFDGLVGMIAGRFGGKGAAGNSITNSFVRKAINSVWGGTKTTVVSGGALWWDSLSSGGDIVWGQPADKNSGEISVEEFLGKTLTAYIVSGSVVRDYARNSGGTRAHIANQREPNADGTPKRYESDGSSPRTNEALALTHPDTDIHVRAMEEGGYTVAPETRPDHLPPRVQNADGDTVTLGEGPGGQTRRQPRGVAEVDQTTKTVHMDPEATFEQARKVRFEVDFENKVMEPLRDLSGDPNCKISDLPDFYTKNLTDENPNYQADRQKIRDNHPELNRAIELYEQGISPESGGNPKRITATVEPAEVSPRSLKDNDISPADFQNGVVDTARFISQHPDLPTVGADNRSFQRDFPNFVRELTPEMRQNISDNHPLLDRAIRLSESSNGPSRVTLANMRHETSEAGFQRNVIDSARLVSQHPDLPTIGEGRYNFHRDFPEFVKNLTPEMRQNIADNHPMLNRAIEVHEVSDGVRISGERQSSIEVVMEAENVIADVGGPGGVRVPGTERRVFRNSEAAEARRVIREQGLISRLRRPESEISVEDKARRQDIEGVVLKDSDMSPDALQKSQQLKKELEGLELEPNPERYMDLSPAEQVAFQGRWRQQQQMGEQGRVEAGVQSEFNRNSRPRDLTDYPDLQQRRREVLGEIRDINYGHRSNRSDDATFELNVREARMQEIQDLRAKAKAEAERTDTKYKDPIPVVKPEEAKARLAEMETELASLKTRINDLPEGDPQRRVLQSEETNLLADKYRLQVDSETGPQQRARNAELTGKTKWEDLSPEQRREIQNIEDVPYRDLSPEDQAAYRRYRRDTGEEVPASRAMRRGRNRGIRFRRVRGAGRAGFGALRLGFLGFGVASIVDSLRNATTYYDHDKMLAQGGGDIHKIDTIYGLNVKPSTIMEADEVRAMLGMLPEGDKLKESYYDNFDWEQMVLTAEAGKGDFVIVPPKGKGITREDITAELEELSAKELEEYGYLVLDEEELEELHEKLEQKPEIQLFNLGDYAGRTLNTLPAEHELREEYSGYDWTNAKVHNIGDELRLFIPSSDPGGTSATLTYEELENLDLEIIQAHNELIEDSYEDIMSQHREFMAKGDDYEEIEGLREQYFDSWDWENYLPSEENGSYIIEIPLTEKALAAGIENVLEELKDNPMLIERLELDIEREGGGDPNMSKMENIVAKRLQENPRTRTLTMSWRQLSSLNSQMEGALSKGPRI